MNRTDRPMANRVPSEPVVTYSRIPADGPKPSGRRRPANDGFPPRPKADVIDAMPEVRPVAGDPYDTLEPEPVFEELLEEKRPRRMLRFFLFIGAVAFAAGVGVLAATYGAVTTISNPPATAGASVPPDAPPGTVGASGAGQADAPPLITDKPTVVEAAPNAGEPATPPATTVMPKPRPDAGKAASTDTRAPAAATVKAPSATPAPATSAPAPIAKAPSATNPEPVAKAPAAPRPVAPVPANDNGVAPTAAAPAQPAGSSEQDNFLSSIEQTLNKVNSQPAPAGQGVAPDQGTAAPLPDNPLTLPQGTATGAPLGAAPATTGDASAAGPNPAPGAPPFPKPLRDANGWTIRLPPAPIPNVPDNGATGQ